MIWVIAGVFLFLLVAVVAIVLKISSQVSQQLAQVNQSLQDAHKVIGASLGSATNIFGSVEQQLGRLEQTNKQIFDISKDLSSFQELLRAPKFRGQMGEVLLEGLLSQILPKEYFQMQYRFRNSDAVDAVIKLGNHLIPVDAKFSLENFQKMIDTQDEQEKAAYRKKFIQDVKCRIDEVASKYILPEENTYNFGLMYIPAENVYYEVIIKEDLFTYCLAKKVVPVSPNTFYAYLQVICFGLKGLKVEENAKEILKNLSALTNEITRCKEDFGLLGSHISNASRKYEDAKKRLDKFADKLENIQETKSAET